MKPTFHRVFTAICLYILKVRGRMLVAYMVLWITFGFLIPAIGRSHEIMSTGIGYIIFIVLVALFIIITMLAIIKLIFT